MSGIVKLQTNGVFNNESKKILIPGTFNEIICSLLKYSIKIIELNVYMMNYINFSL
jgi:hypothetical protein